MYPSQALAECIIDSLIAGGIRDFVYCPGSRNAPFAYALARYDSLDESPIRVHIRLDERSAAFFALGLTLGEGSASPAARACVITTSGSALTHLYPAMSEAFYSHLPLVAISADRPAELHGVGASQTMTQQGIFSGRVVEEWDFSSDTAELASVPGRVARALAAAAGHPCGTPGPIHFNCAFRDPLTPCGEAEAPQSAQLRENCGGGVEVYPSQIVREPSAGSVLKPDLATVVIAGHGAQDSVLRWAERSRVPVFAEPMVTGVSSEVLIPFQQTLCADSGVVARIGQIVVTGRPTLSRPIHKLLASHKRVIIVSPYAAWTDLYGKASCVVSSLTGSDRVNAAIQSSLCEDLSARAQSVARGVDGLINSYGDELSEIGVLDAVWQECSHIFLGASNPVRVADLIAGRQGCDPQGDLASDHRGPQRVWSSRGLAGIDGNVSTALGWARRLEEAYECPPTVHAVMGDLTFLHDASGMGMPLGEEFPRCRIIVLDDQGGSIFKSLEHGQHASETVYERYFGVAQRTDIVALAAAYGAKIRRVNSMSELRAILNTEADGLEVLHLSISRPTEDIAFLRSL
ncbi:2-succinyl-5-enolpyruvyl-6-hydroxy-3-cyclohexene-1-carboxylic-acid synthase [uncultured Actinomyces sp.]|uniref:2-succinyl-5-enolpyruvyl-6-hydroxy-3- cyclohexene-1-carboxylic-acid synthase n=1 Tax=uncultured Actinomyces sp. TaxID=249061 RepID=UPI0028F04922|nr:2-succinyl-5-enolpyruvyl-6-hydroxy-3-cyclohexene-1-carboxylic-acid synthase [uncultured Actinomyces sp.]